MSAQMYYLETDRAFVEAHDIRVVRRTTGGGAVYHDLGNLNYSFITDSGEVQLLALERFTRPVVEALRGLGLQSEASGRNDILVEGRKVSGTAQRIMGGRILHHGTLLFDANPDMVAGALQADPAKFQSKSSKSVRSRVGNIRSFLKQDMDLAAFWGYLKETLAGEGLVPDQLTEEELTEVEQLRREKYATWEWTFGHSPKYSMTNRRRWEGGTLEPHLEVEKGFITGIVFYGDFLSLLVADDFKFQLLPAKDRLFYQNLAYQAGLKTSGADGFQFVHIVNQAAARAAHGIGGTKHHRISQTVRDGQSFFHAVGNLTPGHFDSQRVHRILEFDPVLAPFNGVHLNADNLHIVFIQHACLAQLRAEVQAGLPAQVGKQGVGTLLGDDLFEALHIQRLNVGNIGGFRVGHDGGRVGIDQHDLIAELF